MLRTDGILKAFRRLLHKVADLLLLVRNQIGSMPSTQIHKLKGLIKTEIGINSYKVVIIMMKLIMFQIIKGIRFKMLLPCNGAHVQ